MAAGHPVPTSAANEAVGSEVVLGRPDALGQDGMSTDGGRWRSAARVVTAYRLVIGILALGVLLALAFGHDLYLDQRSEPGRLQEFKADVKPTQGAFVRAGGDAERTLDVRDARNEPGLPKLREASDRQVQVQVRAQEAPQGQHATPDQLRDVALEVSEALGLAKSAALPADGPPPPSEPLTTHSAVEIGVANPLQDECNEALVALAVCPKK